MTKLTKRQAQFVAVLAANPRGTSSAALATAMCLSLARTTEILRALRASGAAGCTNPGRGALWATAERCAELQHIDQRRKRDRERKARRRKAKAAQQQAEFNSWLPVTHRWVDAANARPFKTTAARSVFDQRA